MAWITLQVDTKTDEDDPTTLLGVPAAFEGSSCFAGVPPHERAWWRFWVPQDWVPPLRVEVRLPSGLLVIALPPAGSAASYLRFSVPKSELVSQKKGAGQAGPAPLAGAGPGTLRVLAHCAYCQRTDCQCPVKSQLGRRLSFSRRSSVRRVWLDDRGRGEPPTSLSHRGQHTDTGAPLLHAQASGPRSRPRRASRRRWPRRACRRATRSRSSSPRRRWPRGRGRPPPPVLPSPPR